MSNNPHISLETIKDSSKNEFDQIYQIRSCCCCCNKKGGNPCKILSFCAGLDITIAASIIALHLLLVFYYGWHGFTTVAVNLLFL